MSKMKIIIAGGGTGGHFFPAIAIYDDLKSKGIDVLYMGSKHGIEQNNCKTSNRKVKLLNIQGIQRSLSVKSIIQNSLFPFKFIWCYFQSLITILKFNPQVVVGTGGYASGIPLLAAVLLKKKTLLQEQNSFPGFTTRKLSRKMNIICIAYKQAQIHLNKTAILTGNPIRDSLKFTDKNKSCAKLGLNPKKKILFILGGSQGSRPFNNHFLNVYNQYIDKEIQLLWQTGPIDYDWVDKKINDKNIILKPFINNMSNAYSVADIIISRSGALAIEEMKYCGKAMILIPFPESAENHQIENAKSLALENAAIHITQEEMNKGYLEKKVFELFDNNKILKTLKENAKQMSFPNALKNITNHIIELAQI